MGRDSRQARRQRQRRQVERQQAGTSRWAIFAGIGVIVVVAAILGYLALRPTSSNSANGSSTSSGQAATIDGIQCNSAEQATYHVHGHLEFYVNGKLSDLPAYIGENIDYDCLYWVHTHEPSYGVMHIEAPHKIIPTLGTFFAIWHQPLSRTHAWKYAVTPGQSMKVFVNGKEFSGNPRSIKLVQHTDIAIEIGPPFPKPQRFNFASHQL